MLNILRNGFYVLYTWESNETHNSIKKNRKDQSGATGSLERASGYTMKTRPGPAIKFFMVYMRIKNCNLKVILLYINPSLKTASINEVEHFNIEDLGIFDIGHHGNAITKCISGCIYQKHFNIFWRSYQIWHNLIIMHSLREDQLV